MAQTPPWLKYQGSAPVTIPLGPADPLKRASEATAVARTRQQIAQDAATAPYERRKAAADAAKAEAEARKAAVDKPTVDPALKQKIDDLQLDDVLYAVSRARDILHHGHATGLVGQLGRSFWGSSANDLQGAINTIGGNTLLNRLQALKEASSTGASGLGQLSNREGEYLRDSIASIKPEMSTQAILDGLARVERHTLALKAIQQGKNPDDPKVQKQLGIVTTPPSPTGTNGGGNNGGAGGAGGTGPSDGPDNPNAGLSLTQGRVQRVPDPTLAGVNSHVANLIRSGRGKEVSAYLESIKPGLSRDPGVSGPLPQWINFINQHPGYKGSIGVNLETKALPVGAIQNVVNKVGQSKLGAAALGAADTVSAGTLDNLTSNPALARAGMSEIQQQHPYATLLGQALGAAAPGAGIEAGAAKLGAGPLAATIAGDVIPAGAYGAGSTDDGSSRLVGGLGGGAAGLAGGFLGRGLGRAVSGVGNEAVKRLSAAGVPMTLPQIMGGTAKSLEDRLSGYWGIGDIINAQRGRGIQGWNKKLYSDSLAPIKTSASGQIGEAGVNDALDAYGDFTNNVLSPARATIDPVYRQQAGQLSPRVMAIPNEGPTIHAAIESNIAPLVNANGGHLTGLDLQAIDRGLTDLSSSYSDHPLYGTHIRPAVEDARAMVEGLFDRQAPDVMPKYRDSKEAYKRISTVADAVNAAVNQNGTVLPSQLGTAARNATKKFGGRNAAASGDRPFFQLQRDAQNVLPSKIPDSGTAGRLALLPTAFALAGGSSGGAVGYGEDGNAGDTAKGAGTGALLGLGTAAALTSPYLARRPLQAILTRPTSDAEKIIGDYIRRTRLPAAAIAPYLIASQEPQ